MSRQMDQLAHLQDSDTGEAMTEKEWLELTVEFARRIYTLPREKPDEDMLHSQEEKIAILAEKFRVEMTAYKMDSATTFAIFIERLMERMNQRKKSFEYVLSVYDISI